MIFFDLDGTLLAHEAAEGTGAIAFQQHHADAFPEPPERFVERWRDISEKHMDRSLRGETTHQGQRRERMRELFAKPSMDDAHADEVFTGYLAAYQASWQLFPDVLACLASLQSSPLGIITNAGGPQQRKKLADMNLERYFSVIVVSGEFGIAKPEPEIFLHAAEKAGIAPETCVYIGDRLQTDALAAARAGYRGIWLDRKGLATGGESVPVIRSLAELPALIARHDG